MKISSYADRGQFGTVNFKIVELKKTTVPSTLKSNVGKRYVEKDTYRNKNDIQLTIKGVITGLSKRQGETDATAIDRDRTALISMDDGFYHSVDTGKHSFNGVLVKGSLVWDDDSINQVSVNPNQFQMVVKEW